MATKIFVNLPVKDLAATKALFAGMGFAFNPQFTNDDAACMVLSDDGYVMLLTEPFFKQFTNKDIAEANKSTEVILCISADSREHVGEMVAKAVAGGATTPLPPKDHGFMVQHGFTDLDGHIWEVMWMDPAAVAQPPA